MFPKSLFNLNQLTTAAIEEILSRAAYYRKRERKSRFFLKGKNIVLTFGNPTRTRVSFEMATEAGR